MSQRKWKPSEVDAMSDEDVVWAHMGKFGPPPVTPFSVFTHEGLSVLAPPMRTCLKKGKELTEAQGDKLEERIYGKEIPGVEREY